MSKPDRIPRDKNNDYSREMASQRAEFVTANTGAALDTVSSYTIDPAVTQGNVENFIGTAQVPLGIAGPLTMVGEHAVGDFYIPMATSEGTLVASYSRGMRVISECGGVRSTVSKHSMQRAPVFLFDNALEAREFGKWLNEHIDQIRDVVKQSSRTGRLTEMGLVAGDYLLYVSRFEPENNPDRVVEAYRRVEGSRPLVMVGGAPYARGLARRVAELADDRVLLPGTIYGDGYRQLLFNCRAYIHATEVGGTHPALVEAMGAGRPVLYYDTPENREVAGDVGLRFRFTGDTSLENMINGVIDDEQRLRQMGRSAENRVDERYRWSDVADRYERVLESLC